MTRVCYARIPGGIDTGSILLKVRSAFSGSGNEGYLRAISDRKNEISKTESLCALLLLWRLCKVAGADSSSLILRRTENGKPYFENSELHFSLSHSRGYAAAVLSEDGEVGLDIECSAFPEDKARKLAQRFFAADELSEFDGSPESFTRIWTKKEARVKLLGGTLADAVALEKNPRGNGVCHGSLFYKCIDADGYPVTVCMIKNDGDFDFFREDIDKLLLG